jgi:hypothetical protein
MIHEKENNKDSQSFLYENKPKLTNECAKVLELLNRGIILTVKIAISVYNISSLPRRVKDLRDNWDIENINDDWVFVDGKRAYKRWFINHKTDVSKGELQEWFSKYQDEQPETKFYQPNLF